MLDGFRAVIQIWNVKVKWKNKRRRDIMEADSVHADQEDEMGWNELWNVGMSFISRFMMDHLLGWEDARKFLCKCSECNKHELNAEAAESFP